MLIVMDAELSDPPSSRTCFRDATLFASIFAKAEILVECPPDTVDIYWHWLKNGGAMDFVSDIVRADEVPSNAFCIRHRPKTCNLGLSRLDEYSLSRVITALKRFR
jgi:hypothetical protein